MNDSNKTLTSKSGLLANLFFVIGALVLLSLANLLAYPASASAPTAIAINSCPFCSAIALTFSEQLDANDVVVVAKLLEVPKPSDDPDADFPKAKFEIMRVLKGEETVEKSMKFRTQLVGNYPEGQKFLVMGVDPPQIAWSTPMKTSDVVFNYLGDIQELPEKGPKRLAFFQEYFEHEESVLAFDAYDEFARAPYEDLIAMKDVMQHDKLVGWIKDPDTSVVRRRLYFTMLGVCGNDDDVKMLEEFIRSDDRKKRAGLDALVACYLTLTGEKGVDLIEERFLTDPETDYVDTLAAVSAMRFHGTEVDLISKQRIVKAIRHLLDRPKMADMIIPDLARWEDWSVMERLVQMFKDADDETNWLRVPVITYLRACPLPEAPGYIEELKKIDPDAVKRADFFIDGFDDDDDDEDEDADDNDAVDDGEEIADSDDSEPADATEKKEDSSDAKADTISEGAGSNPVDSEADDVPDSNDVAITIDESHVVLKVPVETRNDEYSDSVGTIAIASDSNSKEIQTTQTNRETIETRLPVANRSATPFVSTSAAETFSPPVSDQIQPIQETPPVAATTPRDLTWRILFIPMAASVLIFLLLWSVVNGWFERLIF